MIAQEHLTFRTVILHNDATEAFSLPAYRLLSDMGHDVQATASFDQAVEMLQHERTDLVVIDADLPGKAMFVSRLSDLPSDQQPRQLAIFTEVMDDALNSVAARLDRSRVHVLLKPLHMHGLLGMLRSIEAKA